MKKTIIALLLLVTCGTLTSFVINKHQSNEINQNYNWQYYKSLKAVYAPNTRAQEEVTIYVFFKQINRGKLYGYSSSRNTYPSAFGGEEILLNEDYKKPGAASSRFRYQAGCCYYFNATLPDFVE